MAHRLRGDALLFHQVKKHDGIQVASACTHENSRNGAETEARVYRLATVYGGNRTAVAHVAGYDFQAGNRFIQQFGGPMSNIVMARAMESVTAEPVLLVVVVR